jgi:hypothetical protein
MKKYFLWYKPLLVLLSVFLVWSAFIATKFFSSKADLTDEPSPVAIEEVKNITMSQENQLTFTESQLNSLYTLYRKEWDVSVATSLLQYLLSIWDYVWAYGVLEEIAENQQLSELYSPLVAFAVFNHALDSNLRWDQVDKKKRSISWDDESFHDALMFLTKSDFTWFTNRLVELQKTNVVYKNLISTILASRSTFDQLANPPQYYEAGLIAAVLMESWYMPLAWMMAKNILQSDKKYILSYEILSQIATKQKKYDDAIKYLTILLSLDTQHISRTAFFLWKSYYWKWDYTNALLYLNQVVDDRYRHDAVRYSIFVHRDQKNITKMMDWFHTLLIDKKLLPSDYLLLFEIIFYDPYMIWSGQWEVAKQYWLKIIVPYIDSCRKNIAKTDPYICKFGEAWRYLSQNRPEKALNDLLLLTKTYPHPSVYKALWDYYARAWDTQRSEAYFMKSLLSTADSYNNQGIFSWNNQEK